MNVPPDKKDRLIPLLALAWLLGLGALALVGPYGLLSWGELNRVLTDRQEHIAALREERAVLANHVALLDPDNVDPDLSSELVRRDLNVVHPDEYVFELDSQP